ncbi:MAG: hypothetical protein AB7L17_19865 [Ilumatobacteraceae bacterium]
MNTTFADQSGGVAVPASTPVVAVKRRTIDSVLISLGVVATVVLAVAGALLTWGANFSNDYVHDELSSQNITFPSAEALTEGGRADLVKFADHRVDTGKEAEGYASYINGHLADIADGATYADLGGPERAANAAVADAVAAGQPQATIDELQAKADAITGQRNTLFKGETLRGLLLSAYAWSTVGSIAGYAALGAFIAAALMAVLVVLGMWHHHKVPKTA